MNLLEKEHIYEIHKIAIEKSAMLGYFFTKGHCFRDGNKRVGLYVVMEAFLNINGYELKLDNDNAEMLTLQIAGSNFKGEEIDDYVYKLADIIELNIKRLKELSKSVQALLGSYIF